MEKYYQDYNWNLSLAVYWFSQIGKHPKAGRWHKGHLEIAREINKGFKQVIK